METTLYRIFSGNLSALRELMVQDPQKTLSHGLCLQIHSRLEGKLSVSPPSVGFSIKSLLRPEETKVSVLW